MNQIKQGYRALVSPVESVVLIVDDCWVLPSSKLDAPIGERLPVLMDFLMCAAKLRVPIVATAMENKPGGH